MYGIENYEYYRKTILQYSKDSCCEYDEASAVRAILHVYTTASKSKVYDVNVIANAISLAYDDIINKHIPDGVDADKIVYRRAEEYLYTQTCGDTFVARNGKP